MLAFDRQGSGPPLILIHGLGATRRIWDPVVELLAAERDVIAIDLPGFGESEPLPDGTPASAANMAEAIRETAAGIGVERAHLAGNSLGGWTALEGGRQGWADSVAGLSPAGLWRSPLGPRRRNVRPLAKRLRPLVPIILRSRRIRHAVLQSTFGEPGLVPAELARESVLNWLDAPAYDDANDEMRKAVFDPAGYPDIPVTLAWGELDRLLGPPRPERRPAGTRFIKLHGVGHTPMWDDPDLIARVLLEASQAAPAATATEE